MEVKPGHKRTEVGMIPEDWDVVAIADLKPFVTSGSRGWARYYSDRGALFVRITNLSRESIYLNLDDSRLVLLPPSESEGTRTQLHEHDVLISITADIGIIGYVSDAVPQPAYINQHIALVRFDPSKANGRFVGYFLASEIPQKLFRALTDQGAKAGMSLLTVQKLKLALPKIREQEKIAEALADADALLANLDKLISKKRDLKQAAMQQLLTGERRLPGFTGEWRTQSLGEVTDIDPENLPANTNTTFSFFYISLEDVDSGVLRGYSEQQFRSAPSRARRVLKQEDVLISTVRPNLKSHLLFNEKGGNWICSTGFAVVRCGRRVTHPGYVFAHLFGASISRQIDAMLTGSNYPAINSRDVRALELPIPAYDEQAAIARVLSNMDMEIAALEGRRDKTRLLKQGMMQELLTGKTRLA